MAKMKRHNLKLGITLLATLSLVAAQQDTAELVSDQPLERFQKVKTFGSGLITRCTHPGTGGYFLSKDSYPSSGASIACQAHGGYLADLTYKNFLLASDIVLSCAGPNKRAWIGSWDYAENKTSHLNNQECLSIFVGSSGPGGGVDVVCPGDRPVLCQLYPSIPKHTSNPTQTDIHTTLSYTTVSDHESNPYPIYPHQPYPDYPYQENPNKFYPPYQHGGNHGNNYNHGSHGKHGHGDSHNHHGGDENVCRDKHNNICNAPVTTVRTVTQNGAVTTLTISNVRATVTIDNVVSTIYLDDIVSTVVLEGQTSTITKIIDGHSVTTTVTGPPSTVTVIGTSTLSIPKPDTTTVTTTATDCLTSNSSSGHSTHSSTDSSSSKSSSGHSTHSSTDSSSSKSSRGISSSESSSTKSSSGITSKSSSGHSTHSLSGHSTHSSSSHSTHSSSSHSTKSSSGITSKSSSGHSTNSSTDSSSSKSSRGISSSESSSTKSSSSMTSKSSSGHSTHSSSIPTSHSSSSHSTKSSSGITSKSSSGHSTHSSTDSSSSKSSRGISSSESSSTKSSSGITSKSSSGHSTHSSSIPTSHSSSSHSTKSSSGITSKSSSGHSTHSSTGSSSSKSSRGISSSESSSTKSSSGITSKSSSGHSTHSSSGHSTKSSSGHTTKSSSGHSTHSSTGSSSSKSSRGISSSESSSSKSSSGHSTHSSSGHTTHSSSGHSTKSSSGHTTKSSSGHSTHSSTGISSSKSSRGISSSTKSSSGRTTHSSSGHSTHSSSGHSTHSSSSHSTHSSTGSLSSKSSRGISSSTKSSSGHTTHSSSGHSTKSSSGHSTHSSTGSSSSKSSRGISSSTKSSSGHTTHSSSGHSTKSSTKSSSSKSSRGISSSDSLSSKSSSGHTTHSSSGHTTKSSSGYPTNSSSSHTTKSSSVYTTKSSSGYPTNSSSSHTKKSSSGYTTKSSSGYTTKSSTGYTTTKSTISTRQTSASSKTSSHISSSSSKKSILLPTITLNDGDVITDITGSGIYTDSRGHVVSVGSDFKITPIGGYTTKTYYGSITLDNGYVITSFTGPGTYTDSGGHVVSVGSDFKFTYIEGHTSTKDNYGIITLSDGDIITGFTGAGTYTDSGGDVFYIGSDGEATPVGGLITEEQEFTTVTLGDGDSITEFTGPGTYTDSGGDLVIVGPDGRVTHIQIGFKTTSKVKLPTVTLPDGDIITSYTGPGRYTDSGGDVVFIGSDHRVTPIITRTSTKSVNLPTITLPDGDVITSFTGPGRYTDSGGDVVIIGTDNRVTPIVTGTTTTKVNLPTITLEDGDIITSFTGPGRYTDSGGDVVYIGTDNRVTPIVTGTTTTRVNLPTVTLPDGDVITSFTGPGRYTDSGGDVVIIGTDNRVTPVETGYTTTDIKLPIVTLEDGDIITSYTGPGRYTDSGGDVVYIGSDHKVTPIITGRTTTRVNLPTVTLPDGDVITSFTGPGRYTDSGGDVVIIGTDNRVTPVATRYSTTKVNYPTITLEDGDIITSFTGPGRYTDSGGDVVYIGTDNRVTPIATGSITTRIDLPTITLDDGDIITSFTGPGEYTDSGGHVFIIGTDHRATPVETAIITTKTRLTTVTLEDGDVITGFTGPGKYTDSGGHVVIVGSDNRVTPFDTITMSSTFKPTSTHYTYPSITLPPVTFPTLNLGDNIHVPNYKGPGIYTIGTDRVVSVNGDGSFSFVFGNGPYGDKAGSVTLPPLSLPTVQLAGHITLEAFTGPGIYTYSPGNVVSIGSNGNVNWLSGGPQKGSNGEYTFPVPPLPTITLPSVNFPDISLGYGYTIQNYHGPGIYTISPGNVLTVGGDGSYSYLLGSGPSGVKTGSLSVPTFSLPSITLPYGVHIPNYSGPGLYTISPGNVVSIGSGGQLKWILGGPQTLPNGSVTIPPGATPTSISRYINGVYFKFDFDIPGFDGPGYYTLGSGNIIEVHADGSYRFVSGGAPNKLKFPNINLPPVSLSELQLDSNVRISNYKGPGIYTISPGNVVSVNPSGAYTFILGSGANGSKGGSTTLPDLSLPTVSLAGDITLDAFTGPGIYTYSPGNVVSIGSNGAVNWLAGGPRSASSGGFTFPVPPLPTATLPEVYLPNIVFGSGYTVSRYHGPGVYTISPNNVLSLGADGSYSYLTGSGFLGTTTGSLHLPTYTLPAATLRDSITVPKYSGPGVYTISPGNIVSINADGHYKWILGGPQQLDNGGITLPPGPVPTSIGRYINGVNFVFPFDIPGFDGPGYYILNSGQIIEVHHDGSYTFVSSSRSGIKYPSITLPTISFPTLNIGGGVSIGTYKGPGVYSISPGHVVSVAPDGSFSFIAGSGPFGNTGTVTLPSLGLPTVSIASGASLDGFTGPGIYTYSPGNIISIGTGGEVNWLEGGPQRGSNGVFTFPSLNLPSVTLPTLRLPTATFGLGYNIRSYHGPGIYTIDGGIVVYVGGDGSYTYIQGDGYYGAKTGIVSLPTYTLPAVTLQNGIAAPKYSGPGIYTVSPGNVVSISPSGGYRWIQGGPQTLSNGVVTLPTYSTNAIGPSPTLIDGVHFKFPFNVPGFNGPGFYTITPGNVIQVRNDGSYVFFLGGLPSTITSGPKETLPTLGPTITLPSITLPTVSLPGNVIISKYSGPGLYTVNPNTVISIINDGRYTYIKGNGFFGVKSGNINLPTVNLRTLSYADGIRIPNYSGPGVYVVSPGNILSIGSRGEVTWLQGGPQSVGVYTTFTTPSYTVSPPRTPVAPVAPVAPTAPVPPRPVSSHSGLTTTISNVKYEFPFDVPNFTGPGSYIISQGNVIRVDPDGTYVFLLGGPPDDGVPGLTTTIKNVKYEFPFDVPNFTGPGSYIISPGNVIQVNGDGSYSFLIGGPPALKAAQVEEESVETKSNQGFVLPSFFPTVSRRSDSPENIKDSDNQNKFFKSVLSLF